MSIKSLIQTLLFLLIVLIIGGIYYLYFYKSPESDTRISNNELGKITNNQSTKKNTVDEEILEIITKENKDFKKKENISLYVVSEENNIEKKEINIDESLKDENLNKNASTEEVNNLTKEIEYTTTNKNGDVFKLFADFGRTNIENSDILDLEIVNGTINSKERSTIYLSSRFASYNYKNQNSKFFENVKINYDNKIITCDNLDLNISENIAVAYSNVIIKDESSIMKAQIITLDIITKDININSSDKIKINTNYN